MKKLIMYMFFAALLLPVTAEEVPQGTKIIAGLNLNRGNVDSMNANVGGNTRVKGEKNEVLMDALYSFGEADDEKTVEKVEANGQYNVFFTERFFLTPLKASYLYDDISEVDYRIIASGGPGYFLCKTDASFLVAEVGAAYLGEKVAGIQKDQFAYRFTERSEIKLSETASVKQMTEYVPLVDEWGDYLLNAEMGLNMKINSSMGTSILLKYKYDSTPGEDLEKDDLQLIAALTLQI